jgi:hypothetical protein
VYREAAARPRAPLPYPAMLRGLQLRAARRSDWRVLAPAMTRLAELIAGVEAGTDADAAADGAACRATGAGWTVEVGPLDLDAPVVALQRGDALLAAVGPAPGGGLRVAAFEPLCAVGCERLLALAALPAGNAWPRALEAARADGERAQELMGAAHLTAWPEGLGHGAAARASGPCWESQAGRAPRRPAVVAAELVAWAEAPSGA